MNVSDTQLFTGLLTLVAILLGTIANRKSVEDMRDVLRAESKAQAAEMGARLDKMESALLQAIVHLDQRVSRIEIR